MLPDPPVNPGSLSLEDADPPPASLEQRVQLLEEAVAGLRDTQQLEERIVDRLQVRLQNSPPPSTRPAEQVAAGNPPFTQVKEGPGQREGILVSPPGSDTSKTAWFLIDLLT